MHYYRYNNNSSKELQEFLQETRQMVTSTDMIYTLKAREKMTQFYLLKDEVLEAFNMGWREVQNRTLFCTAKLANISNTVCVRVAKKKDKFLVIDVYAK